jgi:hypothetical protein
VRELEAALWASQHPTGHVSALGPRVLGLMTLVGERTRRGGEIVRVVGAREERKKERKGGSHFEQKIEERFLSASDDAFAGSEREEDASADSARNDS